MIQWCRNAGECFLLAFGVLFFAAASVIVAFCECFKKDIVNTKDEILPPVTLVEPKLEPKPTPLVLDTKDTPETKLLLSTLQSAFPMLTRHHGVKVVIHNYQRLEREMIALKAIKIEDIKRELDNREGDDERFAADAFYWQKFKEFWHLYMDTDMATKEQWFANLTTDMWDSNNNPKHWEEIMDKFIEEQ